MINKDENKTEEEENEIKKDYFEIKVIGDDIDKEKKKSLFKNDHSKITKIYMKNINISEYIDFNKILKI